MVLRCFIVDDSRHFLSAAQALLTREGFVVVGTASTTDEVVRRVEAAQPDVVLIDVELGTGSGFDVARRIAHETSVDRSRLIMISTYAEDDLWHELTAAPVAAFLPKSRLSAAAIREILGGAADTGDTGGSVAGDSC